jgi:hypothetical protein
MHKSQYEISEGGISSLSLSASHAVSFLRKELIEEID